MSTVGLMYEPKASKSLACCPAPFDRATTPITEARSVPITSAPGASSRCCRQGHPTHAGMSSNSDLGSAAALGTDRCVMTSSSRETGSSRQTQHEAPQDRQRDSDLHSDR